VRVHWTANPPGGRSLIKTPALADKGGMRSSIAVTAYRTAFNPVFGGTLRGKVTPPPLNHYTTKTYAISLNKYLGVTVPLFNRIAPLFRRIVPLFGRIASLHRGISLLHRSVSPLYRGISPLHRSVSRLHRGGRLLRPGVGRFSLSRKTPAGGLSRGGVFFSSNRIGGGRGRRDSGKGKVDGGFRGQ
jgi:hypothetical protein